MVNKVTPAPKSRAPFFLLLLVIVVAGAGGIYYKMDASKSTPIVLAPGTPLPTSEGYLRGNASHSDTSEGGWGLSGRVSWQLSPQPRQQG